MDHHAFAALAQVRILLLPVGHITKSEFDTYAAEIRSFENIRLGDIPDDPRDERARFMPRPLSEGYLHLSFPTHPPPLSHSPLSLLRPSHFPLAVIGIAASSLSSPPHDIYTQFQTQLAQLFPPAALFPLVRHCFVFENADAGDGEGGGGEGLPGLTSIPSVMGNKKLYLGTLLADICSSILGEFSVVVQALESPLGNEYLNAGLFPVLPPLSEIPLALSSSSNNTRRDSLPPLPSISSQPEMLRAGSPLAPGMKRTSSVGMGGVGRQSTLGLPGAKKGGMGRIGATSSHGRLFKVLGDLFLLAGRTEDATVWYNEALNLFKGGFNDPVWNASALEGLATICVLDAWSAGHGLAASTSTSNPTSPLTTPLAHLSSASTMYSSTKPSDPSLHLPLVSLLFCTSVLRHSSLLFHVWAAKGWGPLAFTAMLHPGPGAYVPPTLSPQFQSPHSHSHSPTSSSLPRGIDLARLSTLSHIPRPTISASLAQLHGPWLLHLGPRERLSILEASAGMYGSLGYRRKEALVRRSVVGVVLDLVVCGREESGLRPGDSTHVSGGTAGGGGVGLGINGGGGGGGSGATTPNRASGGGGMMGVRRTESRVGNEGVLRLVKETCRVLGIDLEGVPMRRGGGSSKGAVGGGDEGAGQKEEGASQKGEDGGEKGGDGREVEQDDAPYLDAEPLETYGWPELQVGVVREAVAVAEALPDHPTTTQFALSALRSLTPYLDPPDQAHLYAVATRAAVTAKRRGEGRVVEYWAGRPVVRVEGVQLPMMRIPLEKPFSALEAKGVSESAMVSGAKDPFLYNPRRAASTQGAMMAVQNEIIEFNVLLQNTYAFGLELESFALSTSGVPFESKPLSLTIPPSSLHPVTITGRALQPGVLTIRGCIVRAPGTASREFLLPLTSEEEDEQASRKRALKACEKDRVKYSGLESMPWEREVGAGKRSSKTAAKKGGRKRFMECKVVPEQPMMRIRWVSLTHGAVMMYIGETTTIKMTLENVSSLAVDFVRLSFDDSTIAPAQAALVEGEMSVFETYETEYALIHRPLFSWDAGEGEERKVIGPGEKRMLDVRCFGKAACTTGTIHVSYGYLNRNQDDQQEEEDAAPRVFHTRQLSYPIMVSVYEMLECQDMDILPYLAFGPSSSSMHPDLSLSLNPIASSSNAQLHPSTSVLSTSTSGSSQWNREQMQASMRDIDNEKGWCLFSIEVRNAYGLPFDVSFERCQEGVQGMTVSTTVPPGSTSRIILPLRKFTLPEEVTREPVPTLSLRQFVVTKSKLSKEEEKLQRELFWYREEVFKIVKGRWREAGGTRYGEISLRKQRFSLPMLELIRTESASVELSLWTYDGESEREFPAQKGLCSPPMNDFVYLRTRVRNLSSTSKILTLDHALTPSQYIIYEGTLLRQPVGRLGPGEEKVVETPVWFLAEGKYEVKAEVFTEVESVVGKGIEGAAIGGAARMKVVVRGEDDSG